VERERHVVIGGGLAAGKAVGELREQGFEGQITLVGDEPELPYERPPLTKDYLRGESPREKSQVHPAAFYAEDDIELRHASATSIDTQERRVLLDDGQELGYDALLLATGAAPRRISVPGIELDGVCYLRSLADCDELRERLARGGPAAVIGSGWIGAEFAASARQLGVEVAMIDPAPLPLVRVLGPQIGEVYRDLHREHGVELALGESVVAFEGDGSVEAVRTSAGRAIGCAFAVVAIGVTPRIELAHAAGIATENGVLVDASLATDAPGVFAAGDLANEEHPFYGQRVRVEHWANALNQGPAAARAMLGQAVSYDRIPYFFSDQYDVGMEFSGLPGEDDELVFRGNPERREFIGFWHAPDGSVSAAINVNVWDVTDHLQALIRSRAPIDAALLRDEDTPLAEIAAAPSAK
jgi:3-phenylpropionate/trans-cinnamate dioxygenase ferredoxin reductase component